MLNLLKAIWPPARRRAREAKLARQQAEEEARQRAEMAEKKQRQAEELRIQAYEAHIETVDLNGIATCRETPLSLSEIYEEVQKRFDLAAAVKRDRDIDLAAEMSDEEIEAVTGKLSQTALHWLLEHDDPKRQRDVAKELLDARANITPYPLLEPYVTAVAEAAARYRGYQYPRNRIEPAVAARAILLRSASGRWDRLRKGAPLPLSEGL